jgi:thioredoxin reductase
MTAPQDATHKDPAGDQRLDVVVVGGSQAGLAMAWHLTEQGRRFVVLVGLAEAVHPGPVRCPARHGVPGPG